MARRISSSSRSGSDSGSGSAGDVVSSQAGELPIPVGRNTTGDSCSHYRVETSETCRRPRSCYDCLNVELHSADGGCVLNGVGACQAIDQYNAARDYRADHNDSSLSTAYINYFPSVNASYCLPTDPACTRCAKIAATTSVVTSEAKVSSWNGSREEIERFCVGANGCVCLAACESVSWSANIQPDCSVTENPSVMYTTSDTYRSMLPLFMAVQIALILMVIHRQRMFAGQLRRPPPPRPPHGLYNENAISSPSNRLQLTGWRRMQEELVQREKTQRGLVSLLSPRNDADHSQSHANTAASSPAAETPISGNNNHHFHTMTIHEHREIGDASQFATDDDDIPELPEGAPSTPRRRGSTSASVAMLEDGRLSDVIMRRPTATSVYEERETRSE